MVFRQSQLNRVSEIAGNVSVAWFTAGIISPLFTRQSSLENLLFTSGLSLAMTFVFFMISLDLAGRVK